MFVVCVPLGWIAMVVYYYSSSSAACCSSCSTFRKSIYAQEKVPTNLYEYSKHLAGLELTKLTYIYQAPGYIT